MTWQTGFRVMLFTIVVPGTMVVYLPLLVTGGALFSRVLSAEGTRLLGWAAVAAGAAIYARCAWDFGATGGGTPAPIDPPKRLVVSGLYRLTRNPMYVGILLLIGGEAVLAGSGLLAAYLLSVVLGFHAFVVLYEERALSRQFGADYEAYRAAVPRWGLRLSAFRPREDGR